MGNSDSTLRVKPVWFPTLRQILISHETPFQSKIGGNLPFFTLDEKEWFVNPITKQPLIFVGQFPVPSQAPDYDHKWIRIFAESQSGLDYKFGINYRIDVIPFPHEKTYNYIKSPFDDKDCKCRTIPPHLILDWKESLEKFTNEGNKGIKCGGIPFVYNIDEPEDLIKSGFDWIQLDLANISDFFFGCNNEIAHINKKFEMIID
jgi:hypothetical protein